MASALRELRSQPDGGRQLTIHLVPEELGPVRVEATIRAGVVDVRLAAEAPATRALLADALPWLRADLDGTGMRAGILDVAPHAPAGPSPTGSAQPDGRGDPPGAGAAHGGLGARTGAGAGDGAGPDHGRDGAGDARRLGEGAEGAPALLAADRTTADLASRLDVRL